MYATWSELLSFCHIYDKYSNVLAANYVDENAEEHNIAMGCYGIGIGRTMAAVIEQNHDEKGIIWPIAVAPYHVVIVPVNDKDEELTAMAEELYQELLRRKVEVVLDDRKERPGVKFNDADLLGFPIRLTMGKRCKETGNVELKLRASEEVREIPFAEVCDEVERIVSSSQ